MSPAVTDRNLLFGILALQMDFISRDALIAAMHAWVLDKAKPLGQILIEQKALAADAHALLDALVQKHLQLHNNDPQRSLAALSSIGSAREQLEQIADPDLYASLQQVSAAPDQYATRPPTVGEPTSTGLRFRILRPHARGGLGAVFVARDSELNREVALKEIQERHADDPTSRTRFVLEAEITGGLEHPGIVPVYGLGHYLDGRPYYAMRFIRGDSLKEAIDQFHQKEGPPRDPAERALALRQLLQRFIDVCNAIAYAHSRGVLHRDLKPGNVMLGKYGETLVVDWGLAKPLGSPPDGTASEEPPLQPSSASGSSETLPGAAVGTPQFMSPEQAAGRLDQLGPASDVYSLGATLYCLLTGRPAVQGADVAEILQKVQRGDFPAPRQVKPTVPRPLEAICLKAMALKPEDRYASPRDLAQDVERWLADEAVSAYREPRLVRLGRWVRRHRTSVAAGVAALVVAVVSLTTATVLLTAANGREREARELAQANERKARARFQQAREAVDKFYTQVSDSPEMKAKGVEKLRAKLLESAVEYYKRFAQETEGQEAAVRAERGNAYWRLASLYSDIGRLKEAEASLTEALSIQKHLSDTHPNADEYRHDLARSLHDLGRLYSDTARNELAEKTYHEAEVLEKRLAADRPEVSEYLVLLDKTLYSLGCLYSNTGRNDLAEKSYQEVLGIEKKLTADHPEDAEYSDSLAITLQALGVLYSSTGRNNQAEEAYRESLTISKKLAAKHPESPGYLNSGWYTLNSLGLLYRATGRNQQAEGAYREALTIAKQLAAEHPEVIAYRSNVWSSLNNLANLYSAMGQNERAEEAYRAALLTSKKLAAEYPDVTAYQTDQATALHNLGMFYSHTGRSKQAEEVYREALEVRKKLASDHPEVPEYQNNLWMSLDSLGILYNDTGRNKLAEKAYQEAAAIETKLAAAHPEIPDYADSLGCTFQSLGNLYSDTGRNDLAEKSYQEALAIRKKLAAEQPKVIRFQSTVGSTLHNLGLLYSNTGRNEHAEKAYLEAITVRKRLATGHPEVPDYQTNLFWTLNNLADVYRQTQQFEKALATHQEAGTLAKHVLETFPKLDGSREIVAFNHHALGLTYADMERYELAEKEYLAAIPVRRALVDGHPKEVGYQRDLAWSLHNLGEVYTNLGRQGEAVKYLQESLALAKALTGTEPKNTDFAMILGATYLHLGDAAHGSGKAAEALKWYAEATPVLDGVLKKTPTEFCARKFQRELHAGRAVALAQLGRYSEALADWDRALAFVDGPARVRLRASRALTLARAGEHQRAIAEADELARDKSIPGAVLFDLARVASLASAVVRKDIQRPRAEQDRLAGAYAAKAVALLRRARESGAFKDDPSLAHVQKDPDFEPLRSRPEFQHLLKDRPRSSAGHTP